MGQQPLDPCTGTTQTCAELYPDTPYCVHFTVFKVKNCVKDQEEYDYYQCLNWAANFCQNDDPGFGESTKYVTITSDQ